MRNFLLLQQQYAFIYSTLNEYFLTGSTHMRQEQLLKLDKSSIDDSKLQQQLKVIVTTCYEIIESIATLLCYNVTGKTPNLIKARL